jgi:hypothetical protein
MRLDGCVRSLGLLTIRAALLAVVCSLGVYNLGCGGSSCLPECQQGFAPATESCSCVPVAAAGATDGGSKAGRGGGGDSGGAGGTAGAGRDGGSGGSGGGTDAGMTGGSDGGADAGNQLTSQRCNPEVPPAGLGCVSFTNGVCSRDVPRVFCVDGYYGCPAGTIEVEMCACGSNPYIFVDGVACSRDGSTDGPDSGDGG